MSEEKYNFLYSVEDKRPGCVLLQAIKGGTVPGRIFHELFPSETWIVSGEMVKNLRIYRTTLTELKAVSAITKMERRS